nr:hypothetical protein [Tanacetum cinerariifolium]
MDLQDKGVIDSGCSRNMTGNMSYLTDYEEIDGGYVAFGGNPKGGKITEKVPLKLNNVLFNETECIVLSPNFKIIDESQVLLRVPRENNMYSVDLKNLVPKGGSGPDWLFDSGALTRTMNYEPIVIDTQSNGFAGTKASDNAGQARKETDADDGFKPLNDDGKKVDEDPSKGNECYDQEKEDNVNSTNNVNTISSTVNDACTNGVNAIDELLFDPDMPALEDVGTFNFSNKDEDDDVVADMNNLDTTIQIKEEVYVCQPPGFEDPDFPDRVYKVENTLYGLHQAPRAWYETLSTYLLDNGFQKGEIDKTLFIKRNKGDILLVKVYVDDIIFVKKKNDGIFISQDEYVAEILKKFRFTEAKNASTPMETQKPLLMDKDGEEVDVHMYRSMIGLLMYLTSSRPDIMFALYACARYQVNPKVSHLHVVKMIFRLISWQCKKQTVVANSTTEAEYVAALKKLWSTAMAKTINEGAQIHARVDGKKVIISKASIRRDLQCADKEGLDCLLNPTIFKQLASMWKHTRKVNEVPQPSDPMEHVVDEAVYKELGDSLVRVATTTSRLEAKQNSGNILQNDEDRMKLNELMELCTNLLTRVIDLEKTKTTQANEINSLKRRVKKLESRNKSIAHKLKRLYKVGLAAIVESSDNEESLGEDTLKQERRINDIDADKDITLVNVQADAEMFDADKDLGGEEVFVEQEVVADKEKINEVTLAQDNVQAKIDVDYQLAERLQAEEQQELTDEEKATLFMQLLEKRREHFAAKRAEEKRNKPPIQAQKRKLVQGKEKRAGEELIKERSKKQKVEDDKETADLKELMEIIPGKEEVAINAILLAIKPPKIMDWKIYKERKKSYYQIIRADGKSKMYMFFSQMLTSFDKEDLEDLYKLVKAKYGSTRPVEDLNLLLWGDFKKVFEPQVEDVVWRKQQGYKVLEWKLYDSSVVHSLRMQSMQVFILVEKTYPLTPSTLTMMLEKKL